MTPSLQPMFDLYVKPYLAIIKLVIVTLFFGTIIGVSFWMGKRFEEKNTEQAENKVILLEQSQATNLAAIAVLEKANAEWKGYANGRKEAHDDELKALEKKLSVSKDKEQKLERKLKDAYEKDTEWATTLIPTSYGRLFDEASKD